MKSSFKIVILAMFLIALLSLLSCGGGPSVSTDKDIYSPGEKIIVSFKNADPDWNRNAWIGIVPSDIEHGSESNNDHHKIAYRYIEKKASGIMEFTAPRDSGKYDIRMHDTDSNGKEVTYCSFEVK